MTDFIKFVDQYIAIVFGLVLGALAHVGRRLSDEDDTISWREFFGYLLQLGVIGLVAVVSTKQLGITDNDVRALATAILAISANEVLQWMKRTGWHPLMPNFGSQSETQKESKND